VGGFTVRELEPADPEGVPRWVLPFPTDRSARPRSWPLEPRFRPPLELRKPLRQMMLATILSGAAPAISTFRRRSNGPFRRLG
jgi:hypothetical protein